MVGKGVNYMVSLLAKIFIKNHSDISSPKVRESYGVLCGLVGIFLNTLLFAAKFIAGTITGSIAITADAFNNLSDSGSSLISIIGFRLSGKKPDRDHPFGHGRFEYISGLIVSMLIILMGFELVKSSVENIISPKELIFSKISVIILVASILVKLYMAVYNFRIGKKIGSASVSSTAFDSISDSVSTSAVLIATLIYKFADINLDAYFGLLVSVFILFAGFKAAKDTISPLLGQPPTKEFVDKINDIVMSHEEITGIHDLVVHDYGPGRIMLSLHAEIPSDMNILLAHDIIDNIEAELSERMGCEAVIHMDPISQNDSLTTKIRTSISEIVKSIDSGISAHDLRIVEGETHTNLIFDVVIPQELQIDDKEVIERITKSIKQIDEKYNCVIKIDRPYI